jgi:mevalonate kinase
MERSKHTYRSNGKLLISGEYLVLHGAWSLAVPTVYGQSLSIRETDRETLQWTTTAVSEPWLDAEIEPDSWQVLQTSEPDRTGMLVRILKTASEIRGDTLWLKGKAALADIEFDMGWGLGSSSSLISNIAWWAGIDPFLLFSSVAGGSGYDIACARSDQPLLYRAGAAGPEYHTVSFRPPFLEKLAFVYLGKKQDSASSVRNYLNKALAREEDINRISALTEGMSRSGELEEFEQLLQEHERILSSILGLPPVKMGLFPDYPGEVKSLGAWGGDFVLITIRQDWPGLKTYFFSKGMDTILPYREMVKS